jgi:flagellar biosynthesis anti-sigma factor FlgM
MRIDSNRQAQESSKAEALNNNAGSQGAKKSAVTTAQAGDTVKLSSFYDRVGELAKKASQAPEVRQERVDSLKAAVREGKYKVASDQTAEAMFNELLSKAASK